MRIQDGSCGPAHATTFPATSRPRSEDGIFRGSAAFVFPSSYIINEGKRSLGTVRKDFEHMNPGKVNSHFYDRSRSLTIST